MIPALDKDSESNFQLFVDSGSLFGPSKSRIATPIECYLSTLSQCFVTFATKTCEGLFGQ